MNESAEMVKSLNSGLSITRNFVLADLRNYFNNDGISLDPLKCDGDFDGKGCTFPGEELPASNSLIYVDDIPFYFPSKENGFMNNMVLSGQSIGFDPMLLKGAYFLGAVEGQNGEVYEEEVTVSLDDGSYKPIYLGISNWLLAPQYGERIAFQCSHIHTPDPGQEILLNKKIPDIEKYDSASPMRYFSSPSSEKKDEENAAKGIWRPRVFLQQVQFEFAKPCIGLTFMDNLNFHIFAITLESRGS